ncbi:MAG: hypothetical protein HKN48_06870 [Flavobacteriaceae bacterium]|nr:hypothetical protein [Flavobacteriaceae bacterium]
MKSQFKLSILLFVLPMLALATNPKFKGKYTKTKTLNKEYTVNSEANVEIDNSYGNIDIVTWSENRVVIEVVITTNGNDEEKVQKKLDNIDVDFSGTASKVIAKTIFKDRKNSSWSWWGNKKNNVKMEINYTIKMPVTNSVDLSNDYGAISLNKLEGVANISCDYGQINIGELMADRNQLNFDYTKNSTIGYMKSGAINADYSGFVVEKAEGLELRTDYTNAEIEQIGNLDYNSDYGKMKVGTVTNVLGRGDYIPLRINTLNGNLDVNTDYGSVTVERISSSAGNIDIRSDYAGIKLGYESGYNFDFNIELSYASFNEGDSLEITTSNKSHTRKSYRGYHGSKGSGNYVNIESDYGGVTLKEY